MLDRHCQAADFHEAGQFSGLAFMDAVLLSVASPVSSGKGIWEWPNELHWWMLECRYVPSQIGTTEAMGVSAYKGVGSQRLWLISGR